MNDAFYNFIKDRYAADDSREVPEASMRKAFALFQGMPQTRPVFSLKRLILADAMLRKAGISKKMLFEFNEDSFVQLTLREGKSSFALEGNFNGFDPESVMFFSENRDLPVPCENGVFDVPSLAPGVYNIMFEEGGTRFWIRNVEVDYP